MTRYACRYPDGAPGLALGSMRLCCACGSLGVAAMLAGSLSRVVYPLAVLLALLLVLGLATRLAAWLLGISVLGVLSMAGAVQQLLLAGLLGCCVALAIVGAGAYSVDARRHGRRVIRLQGSPPDQAGDA